MNWLLLPVAVGVPSRKPASPFQSFSNDGRVSLEPNGRLELLRVQGGHTGVEVKRAAGPSPSSGCQWFIR